MEKRFLYQKYLTPADRDEIAQNLGLTNAQVITWFQNRRAKLKRDLEELKNDVVATKQLSTKSGSSDHEFDIDSDSESLSVSGPNPLHSSPKRSRSGSCSSEVCEKLSSVDREHLSQCDEFSNHCDSPEEIIVDEIDDNQNQSDT